MPTSSRDPGIYITREQLTEILGELGIDTRNVNRIFLAAQQFKTKNNHRYNFVVPNKTVHKKVQDAVDRSAHAELLARIYTNIMVENRINAILDPRSSNWRDFVVIVGKFSELFDLYSLQYSEDERPRLYEAWMRYLLRDNVRRSFKRMRTCYDELRDYWDAKMIVMEDDNNENTKRLLSLYLNLVQKNNPNADLKPYKRSEVFQHFVLARMMAEKHRAPVEKWLAAQVEGLAWTGNLPLPTQLCTPNALDRYRKQMLSGFDHSNFRGFTDNKMLDKIIKRRQNENPDI